LAVRVVRLRHGPARDFTRPRVSTAIRTWGLVTLVLIAVAATGCGATAHPGETTAAISPGDVVQLRSGLALVVPSGAEGSFMRSTTQSTPFVESVEVGDERARGSRVKLYSSTTSRLPGSETLRAVDEESIARYADDSVAIVWDKEDGRVLVDTKLPGQLFGVVEVPAPQVANRRQAWLAAQEAWEWLSIEGVRLPAQSEGSG
jgi:hypothetical protein